MRRLSYLSTCRPLLTSRPDSQSTTSGLYYQPSFTMTPTLIVYLAPAQISVHRDDGSLPRFITTYVSDQRVKEQGKNIHLLSAQRAQHSDIDPGLTSRLVEMRSLNSDASDELQGTSEVRATACPAEGNKNTRSRKLLDKFRKR